MFTWLKNLLSPKGPNMFKYYNIGNFQIEIESDDKEKPLALNIIRSVLDDNGILRSYEHVVHLSEKNGLCTFQHQRTNLYIHPSVGNIKLETS